MRRIPPRLLAPRHQIRSLSLSIHCRQHLPPELKPIDHSDPPPPPKPSSHPFLSPRLVDSLEASKDKPHPQEPVPTKGFGPFTRNAETGKRLSFKEREEEKAKEYLHTQPDPNIPLPPLLLRPPGLDEPPKEHEGHGKETRKWWQREAEIWLGRYNQPFNVKAQVARHKATNSYHTEWSQDADRRSVRRTHGKFFMSPHAIFKADKSKYAPNFTGITISSPTQHFESVSFAAGKNATLVALFSTQMAYRMCKPYLDVVESTFPSDPNVGVIRVQFEENWMKWAIIKYFLRPSTLRPQYTPEQQESYILTKKFVNRVEGEATHITNTQVGYILLLDDKSRIRWMATGMPWPGELDVLKRGVAKLIGRADKDYKEVDIETEK